MTLDVAIVIVSHESEGDLAGCVESLMAHADGLELDVTVSDSGSTDRTARVAAELPVTFLPGPNEGFGHAVNRVTGRLTPSRYVLFVNPDAMVVAGSLAELVARCDGLPESGVFGTRQIDERGTRTNTIRRFPSPGRSWAETCRIGPLRDLGERCVDPALYERTTNCDWVMGAFVLVRTSLLLELGGFDERFFLYSEEVDLCRRATLAGSRVTYVPGVTVMHRDIDRRLPDPRSYVLTRSKIVYARKWLSRPKRMLMQAALMLRYARDAIDPRRSRSLRRDSRNRIRAVVDMPPVGISPPRRASGSVTGLVGPHRIASFPSEMDNNPYARLLYDHLSELGFERVAGAELTLRWLWRRRREVMFLHFHWDEMFYESRDATPPLLRPIASWLKLGWFVARLALARVLGYRLVWTVHEVYPRESTSRRLDRTAARCLARMCHVLFAHDHATAERARRELGSPAREIDVIPHGAYVGAYPSGRSRSAVRDDLGIAADSFAFLCFGHLRRYKRLGLLIDAFSRLDAASASLVIAGKPAWRLRIPGDRDWEERIVAELREAARADPRIRLRLGFVPDEEVAELFEACDAAVLARADGWTSGSLILALSLGVPVVAARLPAYESLLDGGGGWLFEPGDVDSLQAALATAAADRDAVSLKGIEASRVAQSLAWPAIAGKSAAALLRVAGSPPTAEGRARLEVNDHH